MTCIATDGKTMAADGRSAEGDTIVNDEAVKMVRRSDGAIIGCAGETPICELVRQWFRSGGDPKNIPDVKAADPEDPSGFSALILWPSGEVQYLDWNFTPTPRALPAAIGSGADIAIGAMKAGKSPRQAIALVAQSSTTVGGKIRTLKPKGRGKGR